MDDVARHYLKGIHARLDYYASWLPNAPFALGDIGILNDGVFERKSNLALIGVEFATRRGTKPLTLSATSESGVDIEVKAKGQTLEGANLPQASAGASLKFSGKGGFVFQAVHCYVDQIEDQLLLGNQLLELHKSAPSRWEREWCVLHTIVRTGSATIAISRSNDARLDLIAKVNLAPGDLARADAGLTVTGQSGDVFHAVGAQGLKPLFKISRIHRRLLGGLRFGGEQDAGALTDPVLDEVVPS